MKNFIRTFLILLFSCNAFAGDLIFKVTRAGVSDNSKTVFIVTDKDIPNTTCHQTRMFKVNTSDPVYSSLVLSVAMQSINLDKNVWIAFHPDECVDASQAVGNISILKNYP